VVKKKDLSRSPLFDVMFIFLNRTIEREKVADLEFIRHQLGQEYIAHAQQDITFYAIEEEERIRLDLEYCTALFKQETIERLFRHFINILLGAAADPASKLSEIDMIGPEEKHLLLVEFNKTHAANPRENTVHELFLEQVLKPLTK
jgi:non-ribosomal peptide synthetase component F